MRLRIVAVGRLKEDYLKEAQRHFLQKISSMTDFEIVELEDEKAPEKSSAKENEKIKEREGEKILRSLRKNEQVILLDVGGISITSEKLNAILKEASFSNQELAFVIGGSLGIGENVKKRASRSVSISKLTFPHQLFRIVLLEQIAKLVSERGL